MSWRSVLKSAAVILHTAIIKRGFLFDVRLVDNFQTIYQLNAAERKLKIFMRLFIFMRFKVVRQL